MYHIFYVTQSERDFGTQLNLTKDQLLRYLQIDILEGTDEFESLIDNFKTLSLDEYVSQFKSVWIQSLNKAYGDHYVKYKVFKTNEEGKLINVDLYRLNLVEFGLSNHIYFWMLKL